MILLIRMPMILRAVSFTTGCGPGRTLHNHHRYHSHRIIGIASLSARSTRPTTVGDTEGRAALAQRRREILHAPPPKQQINVDGYIFRFGARTHGNDIQQRLEHESDSSRPAKNFDERGHQAPGTKRRAGGGPGSRRAGVETLGRPPRNFRL